MSVNDQNDATAGFGAVFPGQGSQSPGMLNDLAGRSSMVEAVFAQASEVLGHDLWRLVAEGPQEELDLTENTQPAMLAAGYAVWRIWQEHGGPQPRCLAGHSLGEYTALVCAGAIAFPDALRVVARRARLMQEATPEGRGAMAAVLGLDDDAVVALCETFAAGQVLQPVNFNAPGQVVIAGEREAVERAVLGAKQAGARRAMLLPVSVAAHSALMKPAAEALATTLAALEVREPRACVLHNVDVEPAREPATIRDKLERQLSSPVRWTETVRRMAANGVSAVIEFGPGRVLSGLNRRISPELTSLSLHDSASLDQALARVRAG